MPANTEIVCDDCGKVIDAAPGQPHQAMYVNYSHPRFGGAGMYYCIDENDDCAARVLGVLPGAPAGVPVEPTPEPAPPAPEPTPEPAPSDPPA